MSAYQDLIKEFHVNLLFYFINSNGNILVNISWNNNIVLILLIYRRSNKKYIFKNLSVLPFCVIVFC